MSNLIYTILLCIFITPCFSQSFIQGGVPESFIVNPVIIDFDNDGKSDFVGINTSNFGPDRLLIYQNTSTIDSISFIKIDVDIEGVGAPAVGDLDGDGDLDILMSEFDGDKATVLALYNMGNFEFEKATISTEDLYRHRISDLDNDGDLDFVSFNRVTEFMIVFINDGNGDFIPQARIDEEDLRDVELSDIDGDGDVDILVGLDDFFDAVLLNFRNNGNGTFTRLPLAESTTGQLLNFVVFDFDQDGLSDILFNARSTSLRYLHQKDNGTFEDLQLVESSNSINSFCVADFNSDDHFDVFVGNDQKGPSFFSNLGTGSQSFAPAEELSGLNSPFDIEPADFDGDGDIDVLITNGDFRWFENVMPQMPPTSSFDLAPVENKIYPNPFDTNINIVDSVSGDRLEIFNIIGVKMATIDDLSKEINLNELVAGPYLFKIVNYKNKTYSIQILIKH